MKRGLILAIPLLLAGLAWAIHAASLRLRAGEERRAADEACGKFDFARAHEHLSAYLKLYPKDGETYLLAASCARRAEFVESFRGPNAEWRRMASSDLAMAERLKAEPRLVKLERMLQEVQQGRRPDLEASLLERVKANGPEAPLILEAWIHGLLRHLRCEIALVCLEALLKLEPGNVHAFVWRGRIRDQTRQGSGREDYERAVQLVPEFEAARYYLAENLLRANRPNEAEAHLRVLNTRSADNLLVRLAWAKCRIALGDDSAGGELLDAWLADAAWGHPRLLEALTARARLALTQGRPAEAEDFARRALHESPLDRYALYHLSQSLNAQGRRQEAQAIETKLDQIKKDLQIVARCREGLAQDPANLQLRHEIGAAYLRLGRPGEALVWLNSVLDREPNHLPTLRTLAEFKAQAGKQTQADELRRPRVVRQ